MTDFVHLLGDNGNSHAPPTPKSGLLRRLIGRVTTTRAYSALFPCFSLSSSPCTRSSASLSSSSSLLPPTASDRSAWVAKLYAANTFAEDMRVLLHMVPHWAPVAGTLSAAALYYIIFRARLRLVQWRIAERRRIERKYQLLSDLHGLRMSSMTSAAPCLCECRDEMHDEDEHAYNSYEDEDYEEEEDGEDGSVSIRDIDEFRSSLGIRLPRDEDLLAVVEHMLLVDDIADGWVLYRTSAGIIRFMNLRTHELFFFHPGKRSEQVWVESELKRRNRHAVVSKYAFSLGGKATSAATDANATANSTSHFSSVGFGHGLDDVRRGTADAVTDRCGNEDASCACENANASHVGLLPAHSSLNSTHGLPGAQERHDRGNDCTCSLDDTKHVTTHFSAAGSSCATSPTRSLYHTTATMYFNDDDTEDELDEMMTARTSTAIGCSASVVDEDAPDGADSHNSAFRRIFNYFLEKEQLRIEHEVARQQQRDNRNSGTEGCVGAGQPSTLLPCDSLGVALSSATRRHTHCNNCNNINISNDYNANYDSSNKNNNSYNGYVAFSSPSFAAPADRSAMLLGGDRGGIHAGAVVDDEQTYSMGCTSNNDGTARATRCSHDYKSFISDSASSNEDGGGSHVSATLNRASNYPIRSGSSKTSVVSSLHRQGSDVPMRVVSSHTIKTAGMAFPSLST